MQEHYFLTVCITWALAFLPLFIISAYRRFNR